MRPRRVQIRILSAFVFLILSIFLWFGGCAKKTSADTDSSMSGMPMMQEDPRSIKFVEGEIREVYPKELIVHTRKDVTLKFAWDNETTITPSGFHLIPGMSVRISIDHIPVGMRAKTIEVQGRSHG